MSKIDIKELLRKLKEEEEHELAEIRQKRIVEEELFKKEEKKRNDEEKLNKLKTETEALCGRLEELRKKNLQLEIEALSWERVTRSKMAELTSAEHKLSEMHIKIWKRRDEFCADTDPFTHECDAFLNQMKESRKPTTDESASMETESEMQKLKESIVEEEETEKSLDRKIEELEGEKQMLLLDAGSDSECIRIKEWIQITRERCSELERRIAEKEKVLERESATVGQRDLAHSETKIFSIVNLKDVKKLSQFNF